jgi:presenilin-like A22 family membrane protease
MDDIVLFILGVMAGTLIGLVLFSLCAAGRSKDDEDS